MSDTEIAHLRTLGALLAAVRAPDEQGVVVSFSARAYDADTGDSSVGVTVSKGGETETAHAAGTDLATAMLLARGACDRKIKAKAEMAKKRNRDSDGNPEGGDSEAAPSRSDDSAGPQGIARTSSTSPVLSSDTQP